MALNVSLLKVKRADAVNYSHANFSTVTLRDVEDRWIDTYITIFLEGTGHEDAAARIAALINEQVVRRDQPDTIMYAISPADVVEVPAPSFGFSCPRCKQNYSTPALVNACPVCDWTPHVDDGPTYDGPDDEHEALRMETEQNISLGQAREAAEEERAYNEEDRLGKEAHLRSARRDDKPWTPHEDQIEEDVRAGRRDSDGEPI